MGKETVTTPGNRRRMQVRKARPDGFTAAKRELFLDTLAMCCTVTTAARAAGVLVTTVNYHRRRDPVWAEEMREALDAGYDMLEAASLAHGVRGGPRRARGAGGAGDDGAREVEAGDPEAPHPEALDPDMAVRMLALRRKGLGQRTGNGGQRARRVSERELNESILAKLAVLDKRLRLKRHEVKRVKVRSRATPLPSHRCAAGPSLSRAGERG